MEGARAVNAVFLDTAPLIYLVEGTLSLRDATPDALQLATALALGCDLFFTNDRALCNCKELEMVLVEERQFRDQQVDR